MAMGTRKVGPAVAAGCTMVIKPAKLTPLSMLALADIMDRAGLPKGVLNVIPAKSAGATTGPLIDDGRLRKLSFTGSTEVGKKLIEQSASQVLKTSMELGGNAPFLVFEDADLDAAVEGALVAKMRNIGEACTAANRFHVAAPLQEEFAGRLSEQAGRAEAGARHRGGRRRGPTGGRRHPRQGRPSSWRTRSGKGREGAGRRLPRGGSRLLLRADGARGRRPGFTPAEGGDLRARGPGHRVRLRGGRDSRRQRHGVWACLLRLHEDLKRALRVCEGLETGMIGLNQGMVSNASAPFGGVKQSGIGREGGYEGIEEYLETKYVAVNL